MYVIFSPTPELNPKGFWEVTDVRQGKEIYSGYAERFYQTFVAQVCVVINHDILIKYIFVVNVICFILLEQMHVDMQQQVSNRDRQCCIVKVTSVRGLVF